MIFEYIGGFHFGIGLVDKLYKRSLFDGLKLDNSFNFSAIKVEKPYLHLH